MFMEFSEDCQKVLLQAKKEMKLLKHPYVGSEHFLLAILKNKKSNITAIFSKYGVDYNSFKNKLIELIGYGVEENDWFLFTPLFKRVIESSIIDSKDRNTRLVTLDNLFLSLIEEGEGVAIRLLMSLGVNMDKLYNEFISISRQNSKKRNKKSCLEEFGIDLVEKAKKKEFDPVLGRELEIQQMIETLLRRKKNNPLLIGKAGVGKTAIVEELARRISLGEVPEALLNKRIFSVSMASLVSGTKYRGEFEDRLNKIISEIEKNKDCILFIDEIHTLVGAGGAEGAIDAANIFKPVLSRGGFYLIGATTEYEYRKYIEEDKALERRFQTIYVDEPSREKVLDILENVKCIYEDYYNLEISKNVLESIVDLTDQYIFSNQQPDKSIEILDSACCYTSLMKTSTERSIYNYKEQLNNTIVNKNNSIMENDFEKASAFLQEEKVLENKINRLLLRNKNSSKKKILTVENVVKSVEEKSSIPIYHYKKSKICLKEKLKKHIFGQDKIIDEISFETYRKLYGLRCNKRPLSFLFVGSTGVGKTYMAELYNKILYNNDNLIRVDMSEFRESHSISKILGSPAGYVGYSDGNNILSKVKSHPNAVLLLDEIEKADKSVINLFLQVLDNGVLKDAKGDEIRFDHVTIIMTSNIGFHKSSIGFHNDNSDTILTELKESLGVEFVNRINKICIFSKIDKKSLSNIIDKQFKKYEKFYEDLNMKIKMTKKIKDRIIEKCNYEDFGARRVEMILEDELDNLVISDLEKRVSIM